MLNVDSVAVTMAGECFSVQLIFCFLENHFAVKLAVAYMTFY